MQKTLGLWAKINIYKLMYTIPYKVAVYAPAERADTLALFHLCPKYTLCLKV